MDVSRGINLTECLLQRVLSMNTETSYGKMFLVQAKLTKLESPSCQY